jgi:hypothetical protein
MATFATLFFVPVVFSVLHRTSPVAENNGRASSGAGIALVQADSKG